ncbi:MULTISPECIES: hypothetical protein [Clostridium]|uniref:Uncharacterized protein n=1 Tax=Clostridium senegalense TaxID=1465809 RepID=A0A6M0HA61_9CLOT|nr:MULTISPECIES: hypothetical protein [Clostridium]NEU06582.1 hypothetical protein [Clostridium senegalense]
MILNFSKIARFTSIAGVIITFLIVTFEACNLLVLSKNQIELYTLLFIMSFFGLVVNDFKKSKIK